MARTEGPGDRRGYDPEATVLMPIVPVGAPGAADATMLLPVVAPMIDAIGTELTWPIAAIPAADAPTMIMPAIPPAGAPAWPHYVGTARPVPPAASVPVDLTAADVTADVAATGPAASAAATSTAALAAQEEQPSVVRSSTIMAVGSLVSRVTGLLRTVAIGAVLGAAVVGNDYNLSNTLPNMVYELLLGGVLASVLVPFLMRARIHDADRGDAYAQRLLTLATVLLGVATVIAVIAAPLLTRLFTVTARHPRPGPADLHLITTLSYLILPEIFFYGLAALVAAILNTRGHFAAPTWTPILNNIVVIATAGVYLLLPAGPGVDPRRGVEPATITSAQILVLGIGTTLGIVVQATALWPALRSVRFRWRWRFDWGELRLRELGRASGWMLCYVGINEVALVILLILITSAGNRQLHGGGLAPGLTIYNSAFLVFMMAHGIVAVSIMTAMMPRMSAAAAQGRFADLAAQFALGTRLSAVVLIPATAAYIVLGRPLAITLFQWGEFTHGQALQTGTVIAVAALGLVPFAISQMQLFAFYAMPDTRTPALLNVPVATLRIVIDVLFYLVVPYALVTAGFMFANALSYLTGALIGYQLLRRRIGRLGLSDTARALGRLAAAAAIAAVPAWLLVVICQHTLGTGKVASIVTLAAGGVLVLGGYVGAALLIKARDVTEVAAMLRGRLRPSA